MQSHPPDIMTLIAQARWREAVTYRDTWPHEYVVVKKDGQQDFLAAFCARVARGEGGRVPILWSETGVPPFTLEMRSICFRHLFIPVLV